MLEAPKGQINPLDNRFVGQRIYLSDLLPPIGLQVANKEFRDCEIIGPANLVFQSHVDGRSELIECSFYQSDGVVTDDQMFLNNVIGLIDCSFRNCSFYKVTILMPISGYRHHGNQLDGMNWLNRTLIPGQAG